MLLIIRTETHGSRYYGESCTPYLLYRQSVCVGYISRFCCPWVRTLFSTAQNFEFCFQVKGWFTPLHNKHTCTLLQKRIAHPFLILTADTTIVMLQVYHQVVIPLAAFASGGILVFLQGFLPYVRTVLLNHPLPTHASFFHNLGQPRQLLWHYICYLIVYQVLLCVLSH